jgi:hypothetical protein
MAKIKELGDTDKLWYKDAIIYQVHVKSFFDRDDDGIGDFPGLISKLDYIADLGANAIWLLPFYPSPVLDDGYDISAFRDVHPDYGTLSDFRQSDQLSDFVLVDAQPRNDLAAPAPSAQMGNSFGRAVSHHEAR